MYIKPSFIVSFIDQFSFKVHHVVLEKNVKDNGRIVTLFYLEALRNQALEDVEVKEGWLDGEIANISDTLKNSPKRNIHLIVMESLLDPYLFSGIELPDNYLSPWMKNLTNYRNYSLSPAYGGSTAQAEFELLCGAPALSQYGTIEFNQFSGYETSCLPNWLKSSGYTAISQNAYKPSYFNKLNAYKSTGFENSFFPKEYLVTGDSHLSTQLTGSAGEYMFDSDFFEQAIDHFLESHKSTFGLNYMLGVYGHYNFYFDETRFQPVVDLKSTEFEGIENIVNQYYYRAISIEENVKSLIDRDPNSLILVVSDHLPLSPTTKEYYTERGYPDPYLNVFYFFDRGKPIKYEGIYNHYDLPWLLINRLSSNRCELCSLGREIKSNRYTQVLANAMIGEN
ncbi:sulfatase-like hydrolase/transferase [Reinekea marina]|uniref:sulfatase-like hydrolase/transferase n=1 Tax=Reinekea marina TaxID=1310421 RepID=UPI0025B3E69D|nr:sulfatase-like hydrolase/transferase [Reinekea marina]MDN3649412.1 sulfatase-like hydrolase/transferase [Reinekea marina]